MKLEVFDKNTRVRIDLIREYNYASYTDDFWGEGSFSIIMPTNDESLKNLVEGNYILFEEGVLGIIKGMRDTENSDIEIEVYGFLLNRVLAYRSTLYTKRYYGKWTEIMRNMATDLFINPDDPKRKIDYFVLSEEEEYKQLFGEKVNVQRTGDTFLAISSELGMANDFGVRLHPVFHDFDEDNGGVGIFSFEFRVIKPVDRTIDNVTENDPVVFSFDFSNLEQLEYEHDGREYCSMAFVASEGQGTERKTLEVGDLTAQGIDRIELYVDARDLQTDDGSGGGGDDPDNPDVPVTSDGIWKPTVSSTGDISWQRSTSETPPATVNIKGPKGETGLQGPQGLTGPQGATGPAGQNGQDGFSPQITENAGNNDTTYKLDITTKTGSFTTPNLKGQDGDSGGSGDSSGGLFAFEIREDGHLWVISDNQTDAQKFSINNEGHLIYTF